MDLPAKDTAARSLAHWSEAGRGEMEAFYALARLDYEQLAAVLDWRGLFDGLRAGKGTDLTLLDVACGSGKFPEALLRDAGIDGLEPVRYDLLDPSPFSLTEAAGALRSPLVGGSARFETTLEDLDPAAGPWDVVWATHALYALQPTHLARAVTRMRAAKAPHGTLLIANGAAEGHYCHFYEAFLAGLRDG